ncbi:unnamed protein product [Nezara viridula]|uniref:Uncharacterized protein n=1 Tax=Nezara viridula TaxID=85310 RepID=A0A9P0MMC4_NEZVI|nr:unnamed protein product [Nezara viridula]
MSSTWTPNKDEWSGQSSLPSASDPEGQSRGLELEGGWKREEGGERGEGERWRRTPRYWEAHHKRVPTPMKKRRPRRQPVQRQESEDPTPPVAPGVPDPYYPIYLPIDQAFKAKYVFHQRRGKTFQERVYVFLEHPGGWICFFYHFTV